VIDRKFATAIVTASVLAGCNSARTSSAAPPERQLTEEAKAELVLSPAEQAAAGIETEEARKSRQLETLQAKGRIALADDVGVIVHQRADGRPCPWILPPGVK